MGCILRTRKLFASYCAVIECAILRSAIDGFPIGIVLLLIIVLAAMPDLQLQIVEFAREHGRVTIGEAIKLTGASRNTLKQHFRALVGRGTLNQHGSGRGVWYDLR